MKNFFRKRRLIAKTSNSDIFQIRVFLLSLFTRNHILKINYCVTSNSNNSLKSKYMKE